MITSLLRLTSFRRIASTAALVLTLTCGVALAETRLPEQAVTAAPAATSNAVLNAQAKVTDAKPAARSVRARQPVRVAAQPLQQCGWFNCGRRQVSWLVLGVGF